MRRADFVRRAGAFGAVMVSGGLLGACGAESGSPSAAARRPIDQEPGRLRVFEWSGYEVEDLWRAYARRFPRSKPRFSFYSSDDQALGKIRSGASADVAHPTIGYLRDWIEADLVQPWDTALIRNFPSLMPRLVEGGAYEGRQYLIPLDWGFSSVLYRTDKVRVTEPSWKLLFEPAYRGRISWWDSLDNLVIAGYVLGYENPWDMTDPQLQEAKTFLAARKPAVRTMWTSQTDMEADFAAGNVWITYAWPASWKAMRDKGLEVDYLDPKEGRLSWYDGLVLLRDTENYHHAHAFADAWASVETAEWLANNYSYGHANTRLSPDKAPAELAKLLRIGDPTVLDEPETHVDRHIRRRRDYARAWAEVKSS